MANIKISELEQISTVENDDILPIVDSSATETKKISINNLKTNFLSNEYGTSNENGYTQQYINTELNKKLTNETVSSTINNCKFYKMGNLVIAFGWFTLNSDTGSFTAPYKPIMRTWIPVNGVNNQLRASSVNGYIDIQTDGALSIKMTEAVTYCTMTFCYLTND